MKLRLTQRSVDSIAAPPRGDQRVFDTEIAAFFVRVYYTGRKQFSVQYTVGGKRKYQVLGNADVMTLAEARLKARETLGLIAGGADPVAEKRLKAERAAAGATSDAATRDTLLGLNEAMDRYFKRKSLKLAESTVGEQRRLYNRDIAPLFGHLPLTEITRKALREMHESMDDRPIVANRLLFLLGAFFNWAQAVELMPEGVNPAAKIERYDEKPRQRRVSPTELKRLRRAWQLERATRGEHDVGLAMLHFLALTGWRKREAYGLLWDSVNRYTGEVTLAKTKTGKSTRQLSAEALTLVKAQPRRPDSLYVFASPIDPTKPLADPRAAWDAIRTRARVEDLRLHDLRHTVASIALDLNIPYEVRQLLIGHLPEGQTAQYSHPSAEIVRAAADRVAAALNDAFRYGAHSSPA